jgi:ATP-dependent DNA helicase PIF1
MRLITVATYGIAASIMPGGRTAHSRFKILIKLGDNTVCTFSKQSGMTTLLRITSVIIWDEVSMTKRLRTGGWSLLAVMSD